MKTAKKFLFLLAAVTALSSCKSDQDVFAKRKHLPGFYHAEKGNTEKSEVQTLVKAGLEKEIIKAGELEASTEFVLVESMTANQPEDSTLTSVSKKADSGEKIEHENNSNTSTSSHTEITTSNEKEVSKNQKIDDEYTKGPGEKTMDRGSLLSFIFACISLGAIGASSGDYGYGVAIVGSISMFFCIPAYILGKNALKRMKENKGDYKNYWMAVVGKILGIIGIWTLAALLTILLIWLLIFLMFWNMY